MHQDIHSTKNSQDKWNKIFDSGHSKEWRSDSYDRSGGRNKDAEILNPMAVYVTISRMHLWITIL
jgi:3-deoxy-D-manno-octulosonic acid (KDO) 8-phosphate synthase